MKKEIEKTLKVMSMFNKTGRYQIPYQDFIILNKFIYNVNIDKGFELITLIKDNKRADYLIIYDILKFKNFFN